MVVRIPKVDERAKPKSDPAPPRLTLAPLVAPPDRPPLDGSSHNRLAVAVREVSRRIAEHPEYSVMLAVNPVMALEAYGLRLTPEMRDHVLRSLKHPEAVKTRREELEASLEKALGEPPKPEDPAWMAHAMFATLKLTPLDIGDAEPTYEPPLNATILDRLAPLRPKPKIKYPPPRRPLVTSSVGVTPWKEKARFLDLAAPVPRTPVAQVAPVELPLEAAWFYKDRDPIAHDLVELGQIRRTGLVFHTPDRFRKIAAGETPNVFRSWFRSVRFDVEKARGAGGEGGETP